MSTLPTPASLETELQWRAQHKIEDLYPDTGPLRRALYVKHLEFFRAGATHAERCFMAANRVGKTEGVGAYESAAHLTGRYPEWWEGRRFDRPVSAWVAGKDGKTVRDILQRALLGPAPQFGTGLIPADAIISTTPKPGVPEAVESVYIKHVSGGRSELTFKSYDAGQESFYGTRKDFVWLDEECELKIYTECLIRTLAVVLGDPNGLLLLTYTPLWGMTDLAKEYLQAPEGSPKRLITATWDDAPHLSKETRAELYKSIPPHEREARTEGRPMLGSGAIYPVPEAEILIDDFVIPDYFPRGYGMDVGWQKTAAIWGAWDRDNDVAYLTGEHYRGQAEPVIHAEGIKARGNWIPGFIDPAANGRSQIDGQQLFKIYRGLGLELQMADNAREAGIYEVWMRLSLGKLKVFRSCKNWLDEFRIFARDENGKIINEQKFHLMAATRYLFMGGKISSWITKHPQQPTVVEPPRVGWGNNSAKWMDM